MTKLVRTNRKMNGSLRNMVKELYNVVNHRFSCTKKNEQITISKEHDNVTNTQGF